MVIREMCPRCMSSKYKKNGHIHSGKQNHQCNDCGRHFVQCSEPYLISDDKRCLSERLLVERISLRGICRAAGVGLKWLLGFLAQCVEALPDHLQVQPITCLGNVMLRRLERAAAYSEHYMAITTGAYALDAEASGGGEESIAMQEVSS